MTMHAVGPTKVVTIEDNLSHSIVFIANDFDTGAHVLLFGMVTVVEFHRVTGKIQ